MVHREILSQRQKEKLYGLGTIPYAIQRFCRDS